MTPLLLAVALSAPAAPVPVHLTPPPPAIGTEYQQFGNTWVVVETARDRENRRVRVVVKGTAMWRGYWIEDRDLYKTMADPWYREPWFKSGAEPAFPTRSPHVRVPSPAHPAR